MTGYHLQQHNMELALASLALYGEYTGGLVVGAILHRIIEHLAEWLNPGQSSSM